MFAGVLYTLLHGKKLLTQSLEWSYTMVNPDLKTLSDLRNFARSPGSQVFSLVLPIKFFSPLKQYLIRNLIDPLSKAYSLQISN